MKRLRYKIIIFIVDAIGMILELVASRLISPYFGSSNTVWTSVIGIILLSTSLGNYIGGKIADKQEQKEKLKLTLVISSLFILLIPLIQNEILTLISNFIASEKIGAIIVAVVLFFGPSMFLGIVNPILIKLELDSIENVGKITGQMSAIGTIGGLTGTFLGGFVLVPNIGSIYILYVLNIIVCLIIPLVEFKIKDKFNIYIVISIIFSIIFMSGALNQNSNNGELVLEGEFEKQLSMDTQYGRVLIYNTLFAKQPVRILNIDSGYESATFIEEDKINELVFGYTKLYDLMFQCKDNIQDVLLIGGAGYSYPKYFISHYPNKNIDVVEIDPDVTEIAKKYFFLDKLIKDYDLENNKRLGLITADGRVYLNNTSKKYDVILNDAFSGYNPAKTLTTVEAVRSVKKSLNEGGAYLSNVIGSLDDSKNSKFLKAEINTIKQVFKNVYLIMVDRTDESQISNNMVIGTDRDLEFENSFNIEIDDNEIIITDDYCPVDSILPEKGRR